MASKFIAGLKDRDVELEIQAPKEDQLTIKSAGREWILDVHRAGPHHYSVIHEGQSYDLRFFHNGSNVDAYWHGEHLSFTLERASGRAVQAKGTKTGAPSSISGPVQVVAVMPGKVVQVDVKVGAKVKEGEGLLILEAMKMENEMTAPRGGVVKEVRVKPGQSVEGGQVMVVIE